jgi:uncharacterized membrane protein (DUF4010 family)
VVAALALAGYVLGERADPGLTTEVALVLAYCLGAYASHEPQPALAFGVCAATLLAFRATLHAAVRSVVSDEELRDALLLGVAAVVVLPLVPNRAIDPFGVVNPFRLWRLVVVFMSLSALGHVAQRAVGPRFGLALAGFASGFVSSAATVATMGTRARGEPAQAAAATAGATASSFATLIQLAILVGTADPHLLLRLAWPIGAGAAAALLYAALMTLGTRDTSYQPDRGHAFRFSTAVAFAALVTGVSLISVVVSRWAGPRGVLLAAGVAGLADTHSAAAAVASVSASGQITETLAELGVLIALSTNTLTKAVLAVTSGGARWSIRVIAGLALLMAASWGAYLMAR